MFDSNDKYSTKVDPYSLPFDKHEGLNGTAKNTGNVKIKCFINRHCPFSKSNDVQDVIVFNEFTLPSLLQYTPSYFSRNILTTPYTEGMHFLPKYVYRHSYLYDVIGEITDDNFIEIPGSKTFGVNDTRYREDQSWLVLKSVFGYRDTPPEEEVVNSLGDYSSSWRYRNKKVNNGASELDNKLDYKTDFYEKITNNEDKSNFSFDNIQVLQQVSTNTINGEGVHWRLRKKTKLYKGEDFFVEFFKQSKSSNVIKNEEGRIAFGLGDKYSFLDANLPGWKNKKTFPGSKDIEVPGNNAVRDSDNMDDLGSKNFDFVDQRYYVVEMGAGGLNDQHYFLIICERAFPTLIVVRDSISFVVGICNKVSGKDLINSEYFNITVRNHLGKLVISFLGTGLDVEPWVIERVDLEVTQPTVNNDPNGDVVETNVEEIGKTMFVDRGYLYVWAGNQICGFTFGPLQYNTSELSLEYPPRDIGTGKDENGNSTYVASQDDAIPIPSFLSLPIDGTTKVSLSVSYLDAPDVLKGKKYYNSGIDLFTQDAAYYNETTYTFDEASPRTRVGDGNNSVPILGTFFYEEPIKELTMASSSNKVTHSIINVFVNGASVKKDLSRKLLNFTLFIQMVAGDHVFGGSGELEYEDIENVHSQSVKRYTGLSDDEWILKSCKTPILTSIRIISEKEDDPRWEDGTTASEKYNPIPKESDFDNKYVIDASDHVLRYNDSWAASDFFSVEHSATIDFLLNKGSSSLSLATEAIESLKDKTFYIEVWAGYFFTDSKGTSSEETDSGYAKMDGFFRLFTGLCHGGSIENKYESTIMRCKIYDYTKILKDQLFFNSPWFDGVKDICAVSEILGLSGFRDDGYFETGSLLKYIFKQINDSLISDGEKIKFVYFDGREIVYSLFALPSGYERLSQPSFKFPDGSPFYDAIIQMAQRSGKLFYFDQFGIAHYEDFFDKIIDNVSEESSSTIKPLFYFTTMPTSLVPENTNSEIKTFPGQLIFNKLDILYNVTDVYNHIKIFSNTPDMTPIFRDDLNWTSLDNPDAEGFIGYFKTMYQQEGLFGSVENTKQMSDFYRIMFRPPLEFTFETYGLPLRALDIVQVDDIQSRVMSVTHNLDPQENKWWMSVKCETFQKIKIVPET